MDRAVQRENERNCWEEIGVWRQGETRCPELDRVIHCRNCEVYTRAGRSLFERELPEDTLRVWTEVMAQGKEDTRADGVSVVIFRLGEEWLAIRAAVFAEIVDPVSPHRVPHRPDPVLIGLVNVHGEIQLCISLAILLGISGGVGGDEEIKACRRMAVLEKEGERWAFPVTEVHGVRRVNPDSFKNVPVTISKGFSTFSRGLFDWEDRTVAFLDDDLLFYRLTRSVQ